MYIRFLEPINDQEQCHTAEINWARYLFWKKDGGICDVRVKEHAEKLLERREGLPRRYELAYEKYGIHWGPDGKQVETNGSPATKTAGNPVAATVSAVVEPDKKIPRFSSVSERMAYIRSLRGKKKE